MKVDMRSIYRFTPFEYEGALPTGGDVYYECECGNLHGASGSTTVKDPAKVKPLRGKLR